MLAHYFVLKAFLQKAKQSLAKTPQCKMYVDKKFIYLNEVHSLFTFPSHSYTEYYALAILLVFLLPILDILPNFYAH